nr:MAG TPA: hypothetical protein [Caudoviricetes sp.]
MDNKIPYVHEDIVEYLDDLFNFDIESRNRGGYTYGQ